MTEVAAAYRYCQQVTRRSHSSFAAAFWMLPRDKRLALHAVYAFCRLADDIADAPDVAGDRARLLERWRAELEAAYLSKSRHPIGVALCDTAHRFRLPQEIFEELLRGVESDLRGEPLRTFEDLRRYCYRVASTVGLLLVRVMGYRNERSLHYAEAMGIAVQLTNVLRDVGEDASYGRIYLPREDLEQFGVSPESLSRTPACDELRLLLACYAERARLFYERAARLLPREDRRGLAPAAAMGRIYRTLLEELQRQGFPLARPVRLSRARRLAIAGTEFLGIREALASLPVDPRLGRPS